ncbi:MAG: peptidylprolyl isomerase [Candidatus Lokiarchaeota archaeon]|nr:peptidylprolyl isomerase [Candidatus Lokiarchaeota archaeon]
MPVAKGNQVSVEYTGTFEDGTVFDSTDQHDGKPLVFLVGVGMMIPGFDAAVIGMEKGEQKEITLQPKDAYGEYDPEAIQIVSIEKFPKNFKAEKGMVLHLGTPDGHHFEAKVVEIDKTSVKLDMNHELAGKVLNFKLKVVDYGEPDDRWNDSCGCGCDDDACGGDGHDGCGGGCCH